ncbi:MAG: antibiotic biosynthesis monooxygenase family protein [Flavobacteriales bacterium]|jgi:quinol monooxygenase YgiN|nr:antibiotic biosynthesis monooxygenase family protein [Flavobacteriales bacterium]
MIVRVVKMTFAPGQDERFLALFAGWAPRIRGFPGCRHLELLRGTDHPHVFFTYSRWDGPEALAAYRGSPVFAEVWPTVKAMFAERAEAWTVEQAAVLP